MNMSINLSTLYLYLSPFSLSVSQDVKDLLIFSEHSPNKTRIWVYLTSEEIQLKIVESCGVLVMKKKTKINF